MGYGQGSRDFLGTPASGKLAASCSGWYGCRLSGHSDTVSTRDMDRTGLKLLLEAIDVKKVLWRWRGNIWPQMRAFKLQFSPASGPQHRPVHHR